MRKCTIVDKATREETGADTDIVDWVVKADYGPAALQQILAQIDSCSHGASRPPEKEGNKPEQEDQGDRQPT